MKDGDNEQIYEKSVEKLQYSSELKNILPKGLREFLTIIYNTIIFFFIA